MVNRQLFFLAPTLMLMATVPAIGQEGSVLTELENSITTAAKGWEQTIMSAARSLFWILAAIEIAVAAIWLAINAASLEAWFAELVRRTMFVGFFAFVLDRGPSFVRTVVDSLFQIGSASGSASPADIFNAGIKVATAMSKQARFGLFEDNALAIAAVFAMVVVVICFSLVAAVFVAVMVEMHVGLLAGMIMLGLGGSSFTKDFAVRYLIYAFSVGMKLMALVMIARIGSKVLLDLAGRSGSENDQFVASLAIAGISVIVFIIAMYVPAIIQGVVQGVSTSNGLEAIRHGSQAATVAAGGAFLGTAAAANGAASARLARSSGSSMAAAALRGAAAAVGNTTKATASAAKDKMIAAPGSQASSLLGLANSKLGPSRPNGRQS
ncbi:conjugal transfer protein TrbL [Aminobacter sp. DSM 101952]|uniref:P-type conjugative transfer protein TrbL n=1 Tax=Aminobacter sp. DSM 101952 TaxID=2735891 RepID=UPI0006F76EDC|nr:P-type conjugative transfer protein TrbL [Aminobacter sp. DSM 101952]KQU74485.1 conjugal transfer protein TrbL [Aminobacter sp. DSM 101952]